MLSYQKTTNFSGTSSVEVSGKTVPFVYFSASVQPDGKTSVNYTVQDKELFGANQETFSKDREEFESVVRASV